MDPRKYVSPGDPLVLAAEQINGLNRLLANSGGFRGADPVAEQLPYTWLPCRSTATVDRWAVLAITGLDVPSSASQFEDVPMLTGAAPTATTTAWGVAVEPIAAGKIGRLAVSGVVQVKAADLGKAGGYQLLYRDATWALVAIGGGLRLGTVAGTWTKGQAATVTEQFGDGTAKPTGSTFTATNYFATITVSSGTRRVACGKVDDKWLLIAAEC